MDRVNGANFIDIGGGRRGFRSQNKAAGISGTEVAALFLNGLQEEVLKVIEASGQIPDAADWTQLWKALQLGASGRADIPVQSWRNDPPSPIAEGTTCIVGPAPTGAWAGHAHEIALRISGQWLFVDPAAGLIANMWTGTHLRVIRFDGAAWADWLANEAAPGPVELATVAEINQGIDASRAVTPAGLRRHLGDNFVARIRNADIPVNGWQSAPPGAPAEGDRYVVQWPAQGGWVGYAHHIAMYVGGAWAYAAPVSGLQVQYWDGRQIVLRYDGATWAEDLATETAPGRVELATAAETAARQDRGRAVTPAGLGDFLVGTKIVGARRSIFLASTTWTVPADVYQIFVRVWGGGGSGGGCYGTGAAGAGGSSGGYVESAYDVTPGQVLAITIGAGGSMSETTVDGGGDGQTGGTTSVGSLIYATGGTGGGAAYNTITNVQGTPGGGGGTGAIVVPGAYGGLGVNLANSGMTLGGFGAHAFSGAPTGPNQSTPGIQGSFPGGGGSGGSAPAGCAGGAGAAGLAIIEF